MKLEGIVALWWAALTAVLAIALPHWISPVGMTWQASVQTNWGWAASAGLAAGPATAFLASRWLRRDRATCIWLSGWFGIGIAAAAAAAAATGITLETAAVALTRTNDVLQIGGSTPFLWILVFVTAVPCTLAPAVVSLPLPLLWRWAAGPRLPVRQ